MSIRGCTVASGGRAVYPPPSERETMKIVVDFDVCQSHGLCTEAAPEIFEIRDDGFLYILNETPPEELRPKVERALRECPTGAIKVEA
jgi:ferredoxin